MKSSFRSSDYTTNVAVLNETKNQWELIGKPEEDFNSEETHGSKHTLVADSIESQDGFDVWWLHLYHTKGVDPCDLFHDEYSYMNEVQTCLNTARDPFGIGIDKVINYTIEVSDFKDMINEANHILAEKEIVN
jgi:hypothetical protein